MHSVNRKICYKFKIIFRGVAYFLMSIRWKFYQIITAFLTYVSEHYVNLVTCDLICHILLNPETGISECMTISLTNVAGQAMRIKMFQ